MATTLHVLSRSPFNDGRLGSCLYLLNPGDGLLLCGDAVHALLAGSHACQALELMPAEIELFALLEDLQARGIEDVPARLVAVDYPASSNSPPASTRSTVGYDAPYAGRPGNPAGQGRLPRRPRRLVGAGGGSPGRPRGAGPDRRALGDSPTAPRVLCGVPAVSGQPPADQVRRPATGSGQGQQPAPQPPVQGRPAKLGAKLAGLPKPSNCL